MYSKLFSRVELGQDFNELNENIENLIGSHSLIDVFRINDALINIALYYVRLQNIRLLKNQY